MSENDLILVKAIAGQPMASSRTIAHVFEKEHKHILEKIRKLNMSNDFRGSNFRLGEFIDDNGDKQPKYLMTRDACMMIVMSFNGDRFVAWKEKFIAAFNAMEKELLSFVPKLPQSYKEALIALVHEVEEKEKLQLTLKEAQPQIEFAKAVEKTENAITVGDFAKVLSTGDFKIGRNNLYKELIKLKILYRDSQKKLVPYQKVIDSGWITYEEYPAEKTKENGEAYTRLCYSTKITGSGQIYLSGKLGTKPAIALRKSMI